MILYCRLNNGPKFFIFKPEFPYLDKEAFFQIPCADPFRLKILDNLEGFVDGGSGNVEFLH